MQLLGRKDTTNQRNGGNSANNIRYEWQFNTENNNNNNKQTKQNSREFSNNKNVMSLFFGLP